MKYLSILFAGYALMASSTSCNSYSGTTEVKDSTSTAAAMPQAPPPPPAHRSPGRDSGFVTSPDGLDYKWVAKGPGTRATKVGDLAELHIRFCIGDTVMIDSYEMNHQQPVTQPVQAPSVPGDLMGGLVKMKAGDSAVFRMLADTFSARTHQTKPAWVKPGDYVTWEIRMINVRSKAEADAELKKKDGAQSAADDKILQEYFKANKIKNLKKTPSGIYYTVLKPGAGVNPKNGQRVTVNYTGHNLKGEKFDSNVEPSFGHVEPFVFGLGQHNVIRGWDEAVALMKKGMKATFYIPSPLAYGANGPDKIGPNAILVFDIELLSFQ